MSFVHGSQSWQAESRQAWWRHTNKAPFVMMASRERLARAVQVLRLTEPQADKLLELRKMHLRNLRELFEDRQRLNLQVTSWCPSLCWIHHSAPFLEDLRRGRGK